MEDWQKKLFIYDFEVVAHDWIVVFRHKISKEFTVFHNDAEAVRDFLADPDILLAGFNNLHYDKFILAAVMGGFEPEGVKYINDRIIGGDDGWNIEELRHLNGFPNQYDLMSDCQSGISLKAFEAHYGMDITESSIPFDIGRPLTDSEVEEMIAYCKADVTATDILDDLRFDYLANKVRLGNEKGLHPYTSLSYTNAKLTSVYLDARKPMSRWTDEREYRPPNTILWQYIPNEVIEYFNRMYDDSISDEELYSQKLNIDIGGCPCTLGFGGIHGAIPCYREEEERV